MIIFKVYPFEYVEFFMKGGHTMEDLKDIIMLLNLIAKITKSDSSIVKVIDETVSEIVDDLFNIFS